MDCATYEELMLTQVQEGDAAPETIQACAEHRRTCGICRMKGLEGDEGLSG